MNAPTNEELFRRVTDMESDVDALKNSVSALQAVLPNLQADISSLKQAQVASDKARETQTITLLGKMDDVKDKALGSVPVWASTTITVLAVLCAALVTAFFTR
ncbi:MAG: hypothetical protein KGL63_05855 [Betaproteobacteria bacterium]|nr:hypothetical protein [Betaproteobacteria bacterium]